ncbi:MAG TPA: hypothetical protein VFS23_13520 [Vicinamibacterales bacterium]|nr:hypothetical protein [Vicinamibacterales bacterium]
MKRLMVLAASAALVLGFGVSMNAQAKKGQPKAAAGSPEAVVYDAASAMAFLTTTNGDWVAGASGAQHEHGAPAAGSRSVVSVKTKAAGSAVVHTYAQGTPGEMETVFHMDGDQLLLTHYCALQNAPVLKFVKSDKPGELKFEFQGGTNFDPAIDAHLHGSTFVIKDANTIEQNSTVFANGKVNQELKTLLHRRASSN